MSWGVWMSSTSSHSMVLLELSLCSPSKIQCTAKSHCSVRGGVDVIDIA